MESKHTLEGVSSLTVRQGDITLFCDVEDFTIVAIDVEGRDSYRDKFIGLDTTYAIRGSKIVLDEDGIAFKVVRAKKPVQRWAQIDVDAFTIPILEAARVAVGAPEGADFVTHLSEFGRDVTFYWEDSANV